MNSPAIKYLACALALMLLAACKTEYHPASPSMTRLSDGYSDRKLGPGYYAVQVVGNDATDYATLEDYFHRHARELCPSGYTFTLDRDNAAVARDAYFYTQHVRTPIVTGAVRCRTS